MRKFDHHRLNSEKTRRGPVRGGVIIRGASWTTLAQISPIVVNVFLTPALISNFGVERYGLYLFSTAVVVFFSSFDGGIGNSVLRWSAMYASKNDISATTRLVTTMMLIVVIAGIMLFLALYFSAPMILEWFSVSPRLNSEGLFLLRSLAVILAFSQVRAVFGAQVLARQKYAYQSMVTITSYIVYCIGMFMVIDGNTGLRGVGVVLLVQAGFSLTLIVAPSLRYLDGTKIGLMSRNEFSEFVSFSGKMQANGLLYLVATQADTFIVGKVLSVSAVAIYGSGANFANQLRSIPNNAVRPISTKFSQAFGVGGTEEVLKEFNDLQRNWVRFVAGWCSVGAVSSYFGMERWLGPEFALSGLVSSILIGSAAFYLWAQVLVSFFTAIGRPGVEVRYALVNVVLNLGLSVPLVIMFGIVGTVAATAVGAILSSLYMIKLSRRRFAHELRPFYLDIPLGPVMVSIATGIAFQLMAQPLATPGALGLLVTGVAALPAFVAYFLCMIGPRRTLREIDKRFRTIWSS